MSDTCEGWISFGERAVNAERARCAAIARLRIADAPSVQVAATAEIIARLIESGADPVALAPPAPD